MSEGIGNDQVTAQWLGALVEAAQKGRLPTVLDDLTKNGNGRLMTSIEAALWATASIQFREQVGNPPAGATSGEIAQWLFVMAGGRASGRIVMREWHGVVAGALGEFIGAPPVRDRRRIELLVVLVSLLEIQARRVPFPMAQVHAEAERLGAEAEQSGRGSGLVGRIASRAYRSRWERLRSHTGKQ